ncbi:MAG: penicillin-binding transpeptidase domain-containing protein, partial [Halobacillus sp.]
KYNMAGKTGTAQAARSNLLNKTLIGYAPHDDPEVAFSVVTPYLGNDTPTTGVSNKIGARIGKAYFDLKEEREKEGIEAPPSEQNTEETGEE